MSSNKSKRPGGNGGSSRRPLEESPQMPSETSTPEEAHGPGHRTRDSDTRIPSRLPYTCIDDSSALRGRPSRLPYTAYTHPDDNKERRGRGTRLPATHVENVDDKEERRGRGARLPATHADDSEARRGRSGLPSTCIEENEALRGRTSRGSHPSRGRQVSHPISIRHVDDLVLPSPERGDRESSPSAVSESSSVRLEWDSSADVGSLALGPTSERSAPRYRSDPIYQEGISPLNRMALQLSSGSSGASNLDQQVEPHTPTTYSTVSGQSDSKGDETDDTDKVRSSATVTVLNPMFKVPSGTYKSATSTDTSVSYKSAEQQFARSHSQEEQIEPQEHNLERVKSNSMIELTAIERRKRSEQPIILQPASITNLKKKNNREGSSIDSVSTVLSTNKIDNPKLPYDEQFAPAHSTPSSSPITTVSPPAHSSVLSSNAATAISPPPPHSSHLGYNPVTAVSAVSHAISKAQSKLARRRGSRDSKRSQERSKNEMANPEGQESSDDLVQESKVEAEKESLHSTQNRGVSEASTDWEYGSRSHTPNESSLSDWQHSGLTYSEVKYKDKQGAQGVAVTGDDKSDIYALTVEVRSDPNLKGGVRGIDHQKKKKEKDRNVIAYIQQSRAVQTGESLERLTSLIKKQSNVSSRGSGSVTARTSRSIQTHEGMFEISQGAISVPSTDDLKVGSQLKSRTSIEPRTQVSREKHRVSVGKPDHGYRKPSSDKKELNKRSLQNEPPARIKKHATHGRHRDNKENIDYLKIQDELESILEDFLTSEEDLHHVNLDEDESLSSNDLSATCLKIHQMLKSQPLRGQLLDLVYAHHLSHLRALKSDIRRVRQMNKIVARADQLDLQDAGEDSSSPNNLEDPNTRTVGHHHHNKFLRELPPVLEKKYTKKNNTYYKFQEVESPPTERHQEKRKHGSTAHGTQTEPRPISSSTSAETYSVRNGSTSQNSSGASLHSAGVANGKPIRLTQEARGSQTQPQRPQSYSAQPTRDPCRPSASASREYANTKLDQLQRTCDIITDLLVLNQGLEPLPQVCSSGQLQFQASDEQVQTHSRRNYSECYNGDNGEAANERYTAPPSVTRTSTQSKRSFRFFIAFPQCQPCPEEGTSTSEFDNYNECGGGSLQDAFQQKHPDVLARVKARQAIIQRIKKEREIRAKLKREYIQAHMERQNGELPNWQAVLPPKGPRLMTSREMRDLTNKHYQRLPEVQEKKLMALMEKEKQTNRLVSQIYANRLKQEALRGRVNLELSKSVIRR